MGRERVVIDGPCLSACTLVLGAVPRERIQREPNAWAWLWHISSAGREPAEISCAVRIFKKARQLGDSFGSAAAGLALSPEARRIALGIARLRELVRGRLPMFEEQFAAVIEVFKAAGGVEPLTYLNSGKLVMEVLMRSYQHVRASL